MAVNKNIRQIHDTEANIRTNSIAKKFAVMTDGIKNFLYTDSTNATLMKVPVAEVYNKGTLATSYPANTFGETTFKGDLLPSGTIDIGASGTRFTDLYMTGTIDHVADLVFKSTSERVRFTTTGNVGIGVVSPTCQLDVNNEIKTAGNTLTPGLTWTVGTSPADLIWYSITCGNGLFVAVAASGTNNRVMISEDGKNWENITGVPFGSWFDVCYGNGLFVAISNGNGIAMISTDARTWTSITLPNNNTYNSICYGKGLFVAVASSGTANRVLTSPNGIDWTEQDTTGMDLEWWSICYGNNLFVAVAQTGTANRVMTSPDGVTWTQRTTPAADNNWSAICYGNGLYVAVARSGTGDRVMTSPNGIDWTARTSAADNNWFGIVYGNGLYVAVGYSGTANRVMTSPDGINWTTRSTSGFDNQWLAICYHNGMFAAVAQSGTGNRVMISGKRAFSEIPHNNRYNGDTQFTGKVSVDTHETNANSLNIGGDGLEFNKKYWEHIYDISMTSGGTTYVEYDMKADCEGKIGFEISAHFAADGIYYKESNHIFSLTGNTLSSALVDEIDRHITLSGNTVDVAITATGSGNKLKATFTNNSAVDVTAGVKSNILLYQENSGVYKV